VTELFPSHRIFEEYTHPTLTFATSSKISIDVFVPDLSIGFEYQGAQHYHSSVYFGPVSVRKKRDNEKKREIEGIGLTLIEVPYWWDKTKKGLERIIQRERQDLIENRLTQ